ncbi:MAG: 23S rRNA (uracil(1939)-C(5))-methyltransferase RlmD [Lachnospiraceae bacterium]|nr:23S rRNA (uracil(1939)-C(5))-methyltransferase RlmD [Lachnospiraceae bacterium]
MKKGSELVGIVTKVNFPNKAIVETEEGPVKVKNALPGDKVKVRVLKMRKGNPEGMLLETIEKAPTAVPAQCPHFGICGGCTFLTMSYEDQLKLKESQTKELLDRAIPYEYRWDGIKSSPVYAGYRNKMEFSFGDEYKDGPLSLGMHKRGSMFDVIYTDECYIVDEDYKAILKATREYFAGLGLKFYHRMNHTGYLRHLLLRKASHTGEIMVALVTTSEQKVDLEPYKELLLSLKLRGELVSILHTVNDALSDVVKSDYTEILYGRDYINESLLGLNFKISEFSFFQTNSHSAEVLYSTAREFIGDLSEGKAPDKTVFDLYSGTGTITQLMAPVCKKIIGVEIVDEAVEAAIKNAKLNGIGNADFICGDVLKVLDDITEKPDFIILDPPRDGVHPKALEKILNYGVDRILYISCKATSLTRDLEAIHAAGYKVTRAVCVDQFPWTANIETVVSLSKNFEKPKDYVQIGIDAEEYYRIKESYE